MFVQYINLSREKCAGCIYETVSHHPPPPLPHRLWEGDSQWGRWQFLDKSTYHLSMYVVYEDLLRQRGSWGNFMINRRKDYSIFIFLSSSPKKRGFKRSSPSGPSGTCMRGYWDGEINDVIGILFLQIVGRSFNIDKYRWHCWVASEMTITESIHNIFKLWHLKKNVLTIYD